MKTDKKEKCDYNHAKVERFERCPKCNEKMNEDHCSDAWFESNRSFNDSWDWKHNQGKYSDFKG